LQPYLAARLAVVAAMLLICVSTVFVKQHSVLDVLAGAVLSGVIYLALRLYKCHRQLT
jgi:PAP2 superfamily.